MEPEIDFAALMKAVGDAVVVVNRQGRIIFWNPAAERMFGFSAEEAVRQSLDLIIPERRRSQHWQGFNQVIATGQTRLGHELLYAKAQSKSGQEFRVDFTVGILRSSEDGSVTAIGALMRQHPEGFTAGR